MERIMVRLLNGAALSLMLLGLANVAAATDVTPLTDHEITHRVELLISQRADLGSLFTVQTHNGVVFIGGAATTDLAKADAERLAQGVPGVRMVLDNAGLLE
jgi:osmotically-inducible protein OsmY